MTVNCQGKDERAIGGFILVLVTGSEVEEHETVIFT